MRHGVAAGVMVKAIAQVAGATLKEAQRAAMFCGDLGELARIALKEGKDGLQAIDLRLFGAIEPMLAQLAKGFQQLKAEFGTDRTGTQARAHLFQRRGRFGDPAADFR